MGKVIRWTLLFVVLIIFASGGVAFYTVFFRPEGDLKVPNLRERSIVEAVSEAEQSGFTVQVEHVASTLPEGRVLAQYPEANSSIRKGQVIVLQVSKGGELRSVPDLRGQSLAKAQNLIREQGFTTGDVIKIKEPDISAGTVIAQSPAAPANIASGRKIDLLIQDGTNSEMRSNEELKIPDVNRMQEREAREALSASGVKIQAVDRVYSPLLPEGVAIETKPAAGTKIRSGQSVILKISTQRRPAGFIDPNSNTPSQAQVQNQNQNPQTQNGSVRRVTSQPEAGQESQTQTQTPEPAPTPVPEPTPAPTPAPASSGSQKSARVIYIVPPLSSPMNLRIEVTDPTGKRDIINRQVKGGESFNTQANYTQECVITIYLGGRSVWQEKHK